MCVCVCVCVGGCVGLCRGVCVCFTLTIKCSFEWVRVCGGMPQCLCVLARVSVCTYVWFYKEVYVCA